MQILSEQQLSGNPEFTMVDVGWCDSFKSITSFIEPLSYSANINAARRAATIVSYQQNQLAELNRRFILLVDSIYYSA